MRRRFSKKSITWGALPEVHVVDDGRVWYCRGSHGASAIIVRPSGVERFGILLMGEHVEERGKGQIGMMTQTALEARLLAVETALKARERRLMTLLLVPHGLAEIIGSFKEESAIDEVMVLGCASRESMP
jgi:hypothetical protein